MTDQQQPVPYTPGPVKVQPGFNTIYTTSDPDSGTGITIAIASVYPKQLDDPSQVEGNARLLAAAYNSYARLGPDAVRLAEADLLGQAVEALRVLTQIIDLAAGDDANAWRELEYLCGRGDHPRLTPAYCAARDLLAQLPDQQGNQS
jgi:hypothetical protein